MNTVLAQSFGTRIGDAFQETFDGIGSFLPNLIGALLIFFIGRFIAKFIYKLIKTALGKANVDSLVDRSGLGGPLERIGFADAGEFFAKLVYWLIMFVVLQLAVNALGIESIQNLLDELILWLPKLIVAIIILFITGAVANFVKGIVSGATATQSWGNAATTAAVAGVWFIGASAALDQVEIAADIVDTLFTIILSSLAAILVIKFGIGGIWAARDRFWPGVYNKFGAATNDTSVPQQ